VGSGPRAKSVFEYLESRGLSNKTLARVKVPAGLDLGKVWHREIAVGVPAELVKLRAGGELVKSVPPEQSEVAEAIDPVCGVTVDGGLYAIRWITRGPHTISAVGGCVRAFEKNPAAFVGSGDESREADVRTRVLKESE
jgi:xanthine dehydrogenase accessory factor